MVTWHFQLWPVCHWSLCPVTATGDWVHWLGFLSGGEGKSTWAVIWEVNQVKLIHLAHI